MTDIYELDLELDLNTADAQLALAQLARNPGGIALWELTEDLREQRIKNEAQRELFMKSDFRSDNRYREIERRAFECEARGRRAWKLKMKKEAEAAWRRADALWSVIDEIEDEQHAIDFEFRSNMEKKYAATNKPARVE